MVAALIGVLVSFGVPNYMAFRCMSKTSEAKTCLRGVYTAALSYNGMHQTFTGDFGDLDLDFFPGSGATANGTFYTFNLSTGGGGTSFNCTASATPLTQYGQFTVFYIPGNGLNGGIQQTIAPCQ